MEQRTANAGLRRLEALVGEWEVEAWSGGMRLGTGRTTFEWLGDGAFLVQHADSRPTADTPPEWHANSLFPVTAVIELDDSSEAFSMLYSDSRGVFRVYRMTLAEGVWRVWRDAPGFHQRFTGLLAEGGDSIDGCWEKSADGSDWSHDFDLNYVRIA